LDAARVFTSIFRDPNTELLHDRRTGNQVELTYDGSELGFRNVSGGTRVSPPVVLLGTQPETISSVRVFATLPRGSGLQNSAIDHRSREAVRTFMEIPFAQTGVI
jgi:hypothetical protein